MRTLRDARRWTRRLALSHYENFVVGGLLTPRRLRQDYYNLYAYCRVADDLADAIADDAESLRRLEQWERWLLECYQPKPATAHSAADDAAGQRADNHLVFTALRPTIERFQIPPEPFLALLDAFRQDRRVARYETFAQVHDYCRRSANPVGHLVLYLAESFDAERARLADEICTGLQLANFCQDVRRDAQLGRVYLPAEDLEQFGVDPNRLGDSRASGRMGDLLRFEVDRAEAFIHRGLPLIEHVPRWLGRDVSLIAGGGLATLRAIRRAGYDVWRRRPTVSRWTQANLMLRAAFRSKRSGKLE